MPKKKEESQVAEKKASVEGTQAVVEEKEKVAKEEKIRQATEEKKIEFARKWYSKGRTKEEIEAIEAEVKLRERDIQVPEEKRAEAFRQTFGDEEE